MTDKPCTVPNLGAAHQVQDARASAKPRPPDQWRSDCGGDGLPLVERARRWAPIGRAAEGRGQVLHGSGLRAALGARCEARAEVATLASREAAGGDSPGADALGAGWGITKGLDPEMALLAEHLLKPLPADRQIETGPFLEAVAHLPPFFGESRAASSPHRPRSSSPTSSLRCTPALHPLHPNTACCCTVGMLH